MCRCKMDVCVCGLLLCLSDRPFVMSINLIHLRARTHTYAVWRHTSYNIGNNNKKSGYNMLIYGANQWLTSNKRNLADNNNNNNNTE